MQVMLMHFIMVTYNIMKIGSFYKLFCIKTKIKKCKLCSKRIILQSECYKIKFNKKETTICLICLQKIKKIPVKKI